MYKISDLLAFVLRKVIKYRLEVVQENLQRVYPDMSEQKRQALLRKIYRNLSDVTLEGIKGISMRVEHIAKRHKFINPDLLQEITNSDKGVIFVAGHYGNWEWGAFSPTYYFDRKVVGYYKPLTNRYINDYIIKKRGSSGTILASIDNTRHYFEEYADKGAIFLMASDQSPTKPKKAIWTDFLGVKTPCLHGIEQYYVDYKLPVVFCDIYRVRRGYYELNLEWIHKEQSQAVEYGHVTKEFMKKLEKRIEGRPEDWLWTHRRWKHA